MAIHNFRLEAVGPGAAGLTFTLAPVPGTDTGTDITFSGLSVSAGPLRIPVTTLAQFNAIRYDLGSTGVPAGTPAEIAAYAAVFPDVDVVNNTYDGYEQGNNLDFAGSQWADGGAEVGGWDSIEGFYGIYDGNGFTIDNLFIDSTDEEKGLFGTTGGAGVGFEVLPATISNLGVTNIDITAGKNAGAIIGNLSGSGLSKCWSTGTITVGTGFGKGIAGGVVGKTDNSNDTLHIVDCWSSVTINGGGKSAGIVGDCGRTVQRCYFIGTINSTESVIGGIVGEGLAHEVIDCWALPNLTGTDRVGGIVGSGSAVPITRCIAMPTITSSGTNVGGLYGRNSSGGFGGGEAAITDSYYDNTIAGLTDTSVVAKTTLELQAPQGATGIYANYPTTWDFGNTTEYPVLDIDFNNDGATADDITLQRPVAMPTSTVPGLPRSLMAVSNSIVARADLTWEAPLDDGGAGGTLMYSIQRSTDDSTFTTIGQVADVEFRSTGLDFSTEYFFRVAAFNSVGTGTYTDSVSITTIANPAMSTAPGVPTSFTATAASRTSVELDWVAPLDNGGEPITGYRIERSTDDMTFTLVDTVTDTSFLDTGLTSGTEYFYLVAAVNSIDRGSFTASIPFTAPTSFTPGLPTSLAATASSSSAIDLAWVAPTDNGGETITGYRIERSTDDMTFTLLDTVTTLTYADTGLDASTEYFYIVAAVNSEGRGSFTASVSETTQAESVAEQVFEVRTTAQLLAMGKLVTSTEHQTAFTHTLSTVPTEYAYRFMDNINMDDATVNTYDSIGANSGDQTTANYNIYGNGYVIRKWKTSAGGGFIELLGDGKTIQDLAMIDVNLFNNTVSDKGILVNRTSGASGASVTIQRCHTDGGVTNVSGIVGHLRGGTIDKCFFNGVLKLTVGEEGEGGIVGVCDTNPCTISNCYVNDQFILHTTSRTDFGGICGKLTATTILNCYSDSHIRVLTLDDTSQLGGLVGEQVGADNVITQSYYDSDHLEAIEQTNTIGEQTDVALHTPTSNAGIFSGWDPAIWDFGTSDDFPILDVDFNLTGSTEDDVSIQRHPIAERQMDDRGNTWNYHKSNKAATNTSRPSGDGYMVVGRISVDGTVPTVQTTLDDINATLDGAFIVVVIAHADSDGVDTLSLFPNAAVSLWQKYVDPAAGDNVSVFKQPADVNEELVLRVYSRRTGTLFEITPGTIGTDSSHMVASNNAGANAADSDGANREAGTTVPSARIWGTLNFLDATPGAGFGENLGYFRTNEDIFIEAIIRTFKPAS